MAPRTTLVLPSEALFSVLMPWASSASTIMLPSSLPSVSILEPTRTGVADCASTLPAAKAPTSSMAALRWIDFMVSTPKQRKVDEKDLTIPQTDRPRAVATTCAVMVGRLSTEGHLFCIKTAFGPSDTGATSYLNDSS